MTHIVCRAINNSTLCQRIYALLHIGVVLVLLQYYHKNFISSELTNVQLVNSIQNE